MCDPVTAVIAIGGALKAGGSIMGGNAQKDAADAQAAQVDVQARQKAKAIRYLAKQTLGTARADYAASGVDVNSGSPLVAAKTIKFNSEVDALNAIASGQAASASLRKSGSAAQTAGYLQGAGSLLGSFGSIAAA